MCSRIKNVHFNITFYVPEFEVITDGTSVHSRDGNNPYGSSSRLSSYLQ